MKARPLDYASPRPRPPKSGGFSYWPIGMPVILALGVAFVQAGSSMGMLAYRLITDGMLASAWMAAMTGIGWGIVRKMQATLLMRLVTAAALGMGIVSTLVLVLGLAGALNTVTAWVILLAGIVAAAWWSWKAFKSSTLRLSPSPGTPGEGRGEGPSPQRPLNTPPPFDTHWRWLWILLMPFLGLALMGAAVPPGLLWQDEPAAYDVTEYHLQVPREWYEAGKITGLKHNVFSYMPMNVEMHDLLAMHLRHGPWAGMYLAQYIHVAIMALAVLAAAAVAGSLSDKPWAAPLAGVAMGVVPWITSLAPIAYNEGGLMLYATLAAGWAITARNRRAWLIAGVMAGLACGVKLTAVAIVVIAIAISFLLIIFAQTLKRDPQSQPRKSLLNLIIFILASIITFSPWMIRNLAWTGNPVFPEAMEILGKGHFSDAKVKRWRAAYVPAKGDEQLHKRLAAAWQRIAFDWQYGYLLLPLAIAAGIMLRNRQSAFFVLLIAVQLIIWLAFTHLQGRFFILVIPLGAILIGIVRIRHWPWIAGSVVALMAIASFVMLNNLVTVSFIMPNNRYSMARQWAANGAFGIENLRWLVDVRADIDVDKLPPDQPIMLVGDAQAFLYSNIPMTRLRYFTVFDVSEEDGSDWLKKWVDDAHGSIVIFPGELLRLKGTYLSVPAPPKESLIGQHAYVMQK